MFSFRIADGSLFLNCVPDFSNECLDYEQTKQYNLLAIAIDQRKFFKIFVVVITSVY